MSCRQTNSHTRLGLTDIHKQLFKDIQIQKITKKTQSLALLISAVQIVTRYRLIHVLGTDQTIIQFDQFNYEEVVCVQYKRK